MNLLRLPPPMVLRLHCSRCRKEQAFDLLTVDQERHFHQYWCRACRRSERITTEMANDFGAQQAAGTDMPPRKWGVIDYSALTSKMPIAAYNPMHIDRVPGPAKPVVSIAELMDNNAMADAVTPMQSVLSKLTRKLIADEEQAVMALRARADETGDQRGVEVVHRSENDGDSIRFKMTATLSDEVPYGLINRRWEFEPLRPL